LRKARPAPPRLAEEAAMSGAQELLAARPGRINRWRRPPAWHRRLHGAELSWSVAFIVPYAAVLLAFAVYPIAYGLWMAGKPSLYAELFSNDEYFDALAATALFTGVGANLNMFLALLLSGFFMRRRWYVKALLVLSMVPWALPTQPAFIAFHWMLIYPGFIDALSWKLFGVDGPDWFNNYWLAIGANIIAYSWKTMPFWTLILLAGRMAIPEDLYDAAKVDGAGPLDLFRRVTWPLLANLYLISTLISTIWTVSDITVTQFVSDGGPAQSTDVLATQGLKYALEMAQPYLAVAAGLSIVPVMILVVVLLMRRLRKAEVQL
jgi:multiple sugar transport system permease protein